MPDASPQLTVVKGPDKGKSWRLEAGTAYGIGRSSKNKVPLSCKSVSSVHAVIEFVDGLWLVTDQNSRNGTLVNGVRIDERRALFDGDRITVGKSALVFGEGGKDGPAAR